MRRSPALLEAPSSSCPAVCLAALLVCSLLAGCSFAADPSPGTPETTLTPVPLTNDSAPGSATPTRTPAAVPFDYPPGYGPSGITDSSRAAAAHAAALNDTERYRVVTRIAVRHESGTDTETRRRIAGPNATYVRELEDGTVEEVVWATDDGYRIRYESRGPGRLDARYVTVRGPAEDGAAEHARYVVGNRRLGVGGLYEFARFGAAGTVERDGETVLVYRATRPERESPDRVRFARFDFRVLVDRDGLVHATEGVLVREREGETVHASRYRTRVTELGNDSRPERPDWVSRTANATLAAEEGYLVVHNTGERAIPLSTVGVRVDDSGYETSLNGTLAPGERLYAARRPDSDGFRFTREPPAEGTYRPVGNGSRVTFVAGDDVVGVVLGRRVVAANQSAGANSGPGPSPSPET